LYTLDNPPAFGTIRLELWEAQIEQIVQAPFQHRYGGEVLESQILHETSKKAGAHHVKSAVLFLCQSMIYLMRLLDRFGGEYIVPQATVNMVNGARTGGSPLATFTFNYRPFGASSLASFLQHCNKSQIYYWRAGSFPVRRSPSSPRPSMHGFKIWRCVCLGNNI
jgi:hypothetical protein